MPWRPRAFWPLPSHLAPMARTTRRVESAASLSGSVRSFRRTTSATRRSAGRDGERWRSASGPSGRARWRRCASTSSTTSTAGRATAAAPAGPCASPSRRTPAGGGTSRAAGRSPRPLLKPEARGFWPARALQEAGARRGRAPVPRRLHQHRSRPGAQLRLDQRAVLGRRAPAPRLRFRTVSPCSADLRAGGGQLRWRRRGGAREYYEPILDVVGSRRGQHSGRGYMEVWVGTAKPIGAKRDGAPAAPDAGRAGDPHQRRLAPGAPLERHERSARAAHRASWTARCSRRRRWLRARCRRASPGWVYARFASPTSPAPDTELALTASAACSVRVSGVPGAQGNRVRLRSLHRARRRLRAVHGRARLGRLGPMGRP